MGLDQYGFAIKSKKNKPFPKVIISDGSAADIASCEALVERIELCYWRKHPNLHGFMEKIYFDEYGGSEDFNCKAIKLEGRHLDLLESCIKNNLLPETEGFFFGQSENNDEQKEYDLSFVNLARVHINSGYTVYYDSWW